MLEVRKKLLYPRPDITFEVLAAARCNQPKLFTVCAPFETGHQMKGLQEQNLLDVAVSTDSDPIALGIKRTISSLVTDKQVTVRDYKKLTTEVLPKLFGVEHDIVYGDLAFLCNMLGNECIKVNTDIGKSECQMAAQIDSDVAYLKRRNNAGSALIVLFRMERFLSQCYLFIVKTQLETIMMIITMTNNQVQLPNN